MNLRDGDHRRLAAEFAEFDAENPAVYQYFIRFSREVKSRGHARYSAYAVMHRIRWFVAIETTAEDFKINNNWGPFYARKLMREYPAEFEGFFELRQMKHSAA